MLFEFKKKLKQRRVDRFVSMLDIKFKVTNPFDDTILEKVFKNIEYLEELTAKRDHKNDKVIIILVYRILSCFAEEFINLKIKNNDFFENMITMTSYEDKLASITSYNYSVNKFVKKLRTFV